MMEIKAVIGKNFGDEGKGQTTHLLCRDRRALVVRHNGGAQAGHTVEEGSFRFVFHQLGSGSLQGCPTFWSRTFLPDLLKLGEEMESFHSLSPSHAVRTIYADPGCACTTVYDVLLNSLREQLRGKDKHGSCGMGIFETILRTRHRPYGLYLRDFAHADQGEITRRLQTIRDSYSARQLAKLRSAYPELFRDPEILRWVELIADDNVLRNSAGLMWENFHKYVTLADRPPEADKFDAIVFENAQGLMLDWDNEEYAPHLTASHTGLTNVMNLLHEWKSGFARFPIRSETPMEVVYVSRSYVTRHGAGRLEHECAKEDINPHMRDLTNVPNPWQGALRYARHPAGEDFFRYVQQDLARAEYPLRATLRLTHLDETGGRILFSDGGRTLEELRAYCDHRAPGLFGTITADP